MTNTSSNWDDIPEIKGRVWSYVARNLRIFWELVAVERPRLIAAVGVLAVVEALDLVLPLIVKELIDYLPTVAREGIGWYAFVLVLLLFAARTVAELLTRFVQEPIFARAFLHLENYWPQVAQEKLLALSAGYHQRENTGRKIAKVSKGVEKLISMLADIFWVFLPHALYLLFNAIVILYLDWRLGLIFVLPLLPAIYIHVTAFERFHKVWEQWERMKERSVGIFCQSIFNVRTVHSFVAEARETGTHRTIRKDMEELDVRASIRIQKWFFAVEMIIGFALITTIAAGLYFTYRGWSELGTVAYITITGNATVRSVWMIAQVYSRMMRNAIAAERMYTLLSEPVDLENDAPGVVPNVTEGRLAFSDVTFHYPSKDEPTFTRFDLVIEPGEMLALVGKSGSGKSSLATLLLRAYDPTGGAVTLDGTDVRTVDRDWYRKRFAFVPQDVEIFDGTIRENVVYAAPDASDELVREALRAACLDEVVGDVKRFPAGLLTQVGERGVQLSGGQKQRVGIARAYIALLTGAEVLVLDEATSSLDSESERVVQRFIEELRRERRITIVVIAHRLSTIQAADRICVLDEGAIAELGTHEQLLRQNGLYHRLVALQQLGELE